MGEPLKVGLIGCGNISRQYLTHLPALPGLQLVAVADVMAEAAAQVAQDQGVAALSVPELIGSDAVDVVLNLTTPQAHAPLTIQALEAGKHVYLEKPFALDHAEGEAMLAAARAADRRIGSAPDTVLGTGIQTARALIDRGDIGTPVAATAFMMGAGHEAWHPNPGFYYLAGGGPLLDMGVYYLTALVTLLGPITDVAALGGRSRDERLVPDGAPRAGERLPVEVDTYVTAQLRHASGVISTLIVSFDTVSSTLPTIEVYGTDAALAVPDPNQFSNPVGLARTRRGEFEPVSDLGGYADAGRGYGLADLARAVADGTSHRQSAELGFHVNEVMLRVLESVAERRFVEVTSRCERPAAVPYGITPDQG